MPTVVQFRRGNTVQNNNFTGANGEISVDTTLHVLRVADGVTEGGFALVGETAEQTISNKIYQGTSLSVTGNVSGSYFIGNGSLLTGIDATSIQNGTSNVRVLTTNGDVAININGSNIVAFTSAGIVNNMGNGVGNIGNSTSYFNTVFAKSTSAQYADLAEMYCADNVYDPGTVVEFGGTDEITISRESHSTRVAGIISTNPSYLMNSTLTCTNALEVALVGRVPCRVVGTIQKGDRLVASDIAGVATAMTLADYQPGCIIGKALENYNSETVGTIEVAVGRI